MERANPKKMASGEAPAHSCAKSTVVLIIEATKKIILEEGYEHVTTNYIAEVTGISVPELYQYFPNRESIVLAVIEETVSMAANKVRSKSRSLVDIPLEEALHEITRLLLEIYNENEFILLRLLNKVPELDEYTQQLAIEKFTRSTNLAFLQSRRDEITVTDLETALLFLENAMIRNIDVFIHQNPTNLTKEQFIDATVKSACTYLRWPVSSAVAG